MATLKADKQPNRQAVADLLGVNPYALDVVQNSDGTWNIQVPNDALPDSITDTDIAAIAQASGGGVDTVVDQAGSSTPSAEGVLS